MNRRYQLVFILTGTQAAIWLLLGQVGYAQPFLAALFVMLFIEFWSHKQP